LQQLSAVSSQPLSQSGSEHCVMQRQHPLTQTWLGLAQFPELHGMQEPLHAVA
jgi:hypothetical protein